MPPCLAMAALHQPIKGILKNKTSRISSMVASSEQPRGSVDKELSKKSQKSDEMNILATYHPADKDYCLMKIDEPSTPYHGIMGDDEDACSDTETTETMVPDTLAKKLAAAEGLEPKYWVQGTSKQQFEMKRKLHYNEGLNIKLVGEEMLWTADRERSAASDQQQNKS
uniref:Protein phosphatase inhibitor 2 n=1 Tax=Rhinopithecus bieti TaxID=61621 RepID=A0A2K6MYZ6_RHIBE